MTICYLIDTDWVIDHLNHIDRVVDRLKELRPQGFALSIISLENLRKACSTHGSRNRASRRSMPFLKISPFWASTKRCATFTGENAAGSERQASSLVTSIS